MLLNKLQKEIKKESVVFLRRERTALAVRISIVLTVVIFSLTACGYDPNSPEPYVPPSVTPNTYKVTNPDGEDIPWYSQEIDYATYNNTNNWRGYNYYNRSHNYCFPTVALMYGMSAHSYEYINNSPPYSDFTNSQKDQTLVLIDSAAKEGLYCPPMDITDSNGTLTESVQLPLWYTASMDIGVNGFGYKETIENYNDFVYFYIGPNYPYSPTAQEENYFCWLLDMEANNNLYWDTGSYGIKYGTGDAYQTWIDSSHPGLYYLSLNSSDAAKFMWNCIGYLCGQTVRYQGNVIHPFPFAVTITNEEDGSLHEVLVTGVKLAGDGITKHFLIHDPADTDTTNNPAAYRDVLFSEFEREMRLNNPLANEFQYLLSDEGIDETQGQHGSLVFPLFYDSNAMRWLVDDAYETSNAKGILYHYTGKDLKTKSTTSSTSGLFAFQSNPQHIDKRLREFQAKRLLPVLQMLLGD